MSHPIVHCRGRNPMKRYSTRFPKAFMDVLKNMPPLSPLEKVLASAIAKSMIYGETVEIDIKKEVEMIIKDNQ